MQNKFVIVLAILAGLSCLAMPVHAPLIPHEYTFNFPCFSPSKITFNYATTQNVSIQDIYTIGNGLYTYTGSPTYFEFKADSVDEYSFTLYIYYENPVNQTILIGLFQGSKSSQSFDFKSIFEVVIIHVTISNVKEPTYPTQEEIANVVVGSVQQDLANYYKSMQELMDRQNITITTVSIVSIISVAISALMSIIVLATMRTIRRQVPRG